MKCDRCGFEPVKHPHEVAMLGGACPQCYRNAHNEHKNAWIMNSVEMSGPEFTVWHREFMKQNCGVLK